MKAALRLGILPFLLFVMVIMCAPGEAEAQSEPGPARKPEYLGHSGQARHFVPKERPTPAPDELVAPLPPGNEELNQPSVPAGEAQEIYRYQGPGFRGVAGTGIDQSGVEQKR